METSHPIITITKKLLTFTTFAILTAVSGCNKNPPPPPPTVPKTQAIVDTIGNRVEVTLQGITFDSSDTINAVLNEVPTAKTQFTLDAAMLVSVFRTNNPVPDFQKTINFTLPADNGQKLDLLGAKVGAVLKQGHYMIRLTVIDGPRRISLEPMLAIEISDNYTE